MFWKMEKENHEKPLTYINEYLLSFFEFAATSGSKMFKKAEWLSYCTNDGEWLYGLYEKDTKNGKNMQKSVDDLFHLDKAEREKIYHAILHDMKFYQFHLSSFKLESVELKQEYQEILKNFYLYFYNEVLCNGKFRLTGLHEAFGRAEFAEQFFKGKNKVLEGVCPVCLHTLGKAQKEAQVEHYFGKAAVPCLALHPYNLYFCCPTCNGTYKGSKSPFYKGNKDVEKIFLPYLDTVSDEVTLEFEHESKQDIIKMKPRRPAMKSQH